MRHASIQQTVSTGRVWHFDWDTLCLITCKFLPSTTGWPGIFLSLFFSFHFSLCLSQSLFLPLSLSLLYSMMHDAIYYITACICILRLWRASLIISQHMQSCREGLVMESKAVSSQENNRVCHRRRKKFWEGAHLYTQTRQSNDIFISVLFGTTKGTFKLGYLMQYYRSIQAL